MARADAFRTLGFTGSGTATSRLPSKLSPSIAWRKTTKSASRETLSSHRKGTIDNTHALELEALRTD